MNIKFRNYCMLIMGKTDGCKLEIGKIAEGNPKFLDAKGITISVFLSAAEPGEISDYFKSLNRNFLVFDMDPNVSGYHLTNDKIFDALFGHIKGQYEMELEEMSNRLIDDIKSGNNKIVSGGTNGYNSTESSTLIKEEVINMSKDEQSILMNEILDKGVDNMSKLDKEILDILTKTT